MNLKRYNLQIKTDTLSEGGKDVPKVPNVPMPDFVDSVSAGVATVIVPHEFVNIAIRSQQAFHNRQIAALETRYTIALNEAVKEAVNDATRELEFDYSYIDAAEKAASRAPAFTLTAEQKQIQNAIVTDNAYLFSLDDED